MLKSRNFGKFVSEVQSLLSHCELSNDNPLRNPNVWRFMGSGIADNGYFVMRKTASYNYSRGLDCIRKQLAKDSVEVSEDYLNDSYYQFVMSCKRDNGDISSACQSWLNKLYALRYKQFKLLIPISHYDYREEIDLGVIKVVKLTDDILQQNFDVELRDDYFNAARLIEFNDTDIFAIVGVESLESEHAEELGYRLAEKFICATKLIDPYSYIQLRKWDVNEIPENILVEEKKQPISSKMRKHHLRARTNPEATFYNDLKPYWDKLTVFLYSDTHTDLQGVIISALYWLGEANIHADSRVKLFLNYVAGLDWIVLHESSNRKKSVLFGKRCSRIFYGDEKHWASWQSYYRKRSNILHEKLVYVYKEEIDTLMVCLRNLLLQLVSVADKYSTLKEVLDKEYGIK